MKKINVLYVLLIVLLLSSCENMDPKLPDDSLPPVNLISLVSSYQEKLTSIIEGDETANQLLFAYQNQLNLDEDDPFFNTKETYLETYNKQRDNAQDVKLSPHLMIYKDLLDDVLEEIETLDVDSVEAQIYVDFRDFMELDAYVSVTSDLGIVVKLTVSFLGYDIYHGIKFGYQDDDFYLRELSMGGEIGRFDYFEFLENHQMIDIRYSSDSYWYRYQNQNDNTYYEISRNNSEHYDDYVLSWFNPITSVRTRIIRSGEGHLNHFELFNYQGICFTFTEYLDNGRIDVSWQLLEATGWDSVYYEENRPNPLNGIYSNGEKILTDARMYIDLNINFANVMIGYNFLKSELTDEILNLSFYGLNFNYDEINLNFIDSTILNAFEESSYLSVYQGIDFVNDDLSQALYAAIDPDIKP